MFSKGQDEFQFKKKNFLYMFDFIKNYNLDLKFGFNKTY